MVTPAFESGASFSADRVYRYALWRWWSASRNNPLVVIGFNPSTADENVDDPTIRRCIGYAKRWGHDGLVMLNLFAFRSTDPLGLRSTDDPVGPGNDETIRFHATGGGRVLCAWGAHPLAHERARSVVGLLAAAGVEVYCLDTTKDGHPSHPLYLSKDLEPIKFVLDLLPRAVRVTMKGWACPTCSSWYGGCAESEHAARICCAKEAPCRDCSVVMVPKFSGVCKECCKIDRDRRRAESWVKALEGAAPYAGGPVFCENLDRYFFGDDGPVKETPLEEALAALRGHDVAAEDARLFSCTPNNGSEFSMEDHLADDLPDEDHGGDGRLNDDAAPERRSGVLVSDPGGIISATFRRMTWPRSRRSSTWATSSTTYTGPSWRR